MAKNTQLEKENESDLEIGDPLPELECFRNFLRNDLERVIEKAMLYINAKPRVMAVLYPHYCRLGDGASHSMAIVDIGGHHYTAEIDLRYDTIYIRFKDFGIITVTFDWDKCKAKAVFTEIPNEPVDEKWKEYRYHDRR